VHKAKRWGIEWRIARTGHVHLLRGTSSKALRQVQEFKDLEAARAAIRGSRAVLG